MFGNRFINDYVRKFGNLSFQEKPFNNVDACIFVTIAYCNFECVAPVLANNTWTPFYLKDLNDFDLAIVSTSATFGKDNEILLRLLRTSKRYNETAVKFVYKVHNAKLSNQFFAVTFEIPFVGHFIAYRGTDSTVIGWREDLLCSVRKVIPSQLDALDYMNIVSELVEGPLLIGGHSKGGNLSLFTSVNISKKIRDRVVNVYTFDGNGLPTKDYYKSEGYLEIKDKIIFICPEDCIIGEIFYNPKKCLVVKSKGKRLGQHYPHFWKVDLEKGDFMYTPERTVRARQRHRCLKIWNNECSIEDKSLLITFITRAFGDDNSTITDFVNKKFKVFALLKTMRQFNENERNRMKISYKRLKQINKECIKYYKDKDNVEED